jgi:hypothetical protein
MPKIELQIFGNEILKGVAIKNTEVSEAVDNIYLDTHIHMAWADNDG